MMPLPRLMVAPNGARRTRDDHPALPVTLDEIIDTAISCQRAGAEGLHLHLRDEQGRHVLDAGRYREALAELAARVPGMAVQITTEAAGRYEAAHQRQVALEAGAALVSSSIREIMAGSTRAEARAFYEECAGRGIAVQHILYEPDDLALLERVLPSELFSSPDLQLLFVLGRYAPGHDSRPEELHPFLQALRARRITPDWAVCAFGRGESACLAEAARRGGKLRVGFENSLWNADGSLAADNAERVAEAACLLQLEDHPDP